MLEHTSTSNTLYFLYLAHSLARRRLAKPSLFSCLRTLSIVTGVCTPHLSQRYTRMNACYCRRQERDGQMNSPLSREQEKTKLDGGDEVAVQGDVAVCHARRIEGETGIPLAVEQDEAAGGMRAFGEKVNGFAGGDIGCRSIAGGGRRCIDAGRRLAKKIDGGFGHNDFYDGFAVGRGRDAATFGVGLKAPAR